MVKVGTLESNRTYWDWSTVESALLQVIIDAIRVSKNKDNVQKARTKMHNSSECAFVRGSRTSSMVHRTNYVLVQSTRVDFNIWSLSRTIRALE